MLERRRTEEGLLEVKQTLMSFHGTQVSYWYFDTQRWLRSLHGRQGDAPTEPMTDSAIAWVRKYHLPAAT